MSSNLFSQAEIDRLPTILDVVEQISAEENKIALHFVSQIPSPEHLDEGRYMYVSEQNDRNVVRLMPTSQSPFKYYRGQSKYHTPCVPSLFRSKKAGELPTTEDIAERLIKVCEFVLLLVQHPVYRIVSQNIMVDSVALAQHYGLATEYLDITNSKWVAAFFASTRYDSETDTYYPVGRDYDDGFGVMYISKDFNRGELPKEFFDKNGVIGYQYFERPTKQSSFGYGLLIGEDFNESPYFNKVFFRHDIEASTIVYNMSYRQNRFIPKDELSKLANKILVSTIVTRRAVDLCRCNYFYDRNERFLDDICMKKGLTIREDNTPIADFEKTILESDLKHWMEFGRYDLESRILPIVPVTTVNLGNRNDKNSKLYE